MIIKNGIILTFGEDCLLDRNADSSMRPGHTEEELPRCQERCLPA
jgi:hypothetical protein